MHQVGDRYEVEQLVSHASLFTSCTCNRQLLRSDPLPLCAAAAQLVCPIRRSSLPSLSDRVP